MKNRQFFALALAGILAMVGMSGTLQIKAQDNVMEREVGMTLNTPGGVAEYGRGTASILIRGNSGQTLKDKKFHVYQIFRAENAAGLESVQYTINEPFETVLKRIVGRKLSKEPDKITEYEVIDYMQSLNTHAVEGALAAQPPEAAYSAYRYFVEELRNEIVKEGITGDVVNVTGVREDNSVLLNGLEYGYYLVDEVTSVGTTHSASSLCMVNTANSKADIHIKSDYPTVTKKILEDDGAAGWNDIGDYEIGQTVPYRLESDIPNMNGYDTYYYAWHDVMDEALTFQADSVAIKIYETSDLSSKSYILTDSEFSVVENPGKGDTFKVEISDIKEIVDREFHNLNADHENVYGQHVVLTYHAVLNDYAARDTGRPGFENDVKLEFSNNPDCDGTGSTGETPWDTVVCFTYKFNVMKTNNYALKLEGAKFRLYSDAACTNEVYVKSEDDGYHVINRDFVGGNDHTGGRVPEEAEEMISNTDGRFEIVGLDQGTYYLKETKAPSGYRPLLNPIVLTVVPTYAEDRNHYIKGDGKTEKALVKLSASASVKEFLAGTYKETEQNLETDVNDGSANITVVNMVGKKLPLTGSSATMLCLGAGMAMMFLAGRKRKKETEDGEKQ